MTRLNNSKWDINKNLKCDKTQKIKIGQYSKNLNVKKKTKNVTKKTCDKIRRKKIKMRRKKTQKLKMLQKTTNEK